MVHFHVYKISENGQSISKSMVHFHVYKISDLTSGICCIRQRLTDRLINGECLDCQEC